MLITFTPDKHRFGSRLWIASGAVVTGKVGKLLSFDIQGLFPMFKQFFQVLFTKVNV
jgi:hypothetical protein